MGWVRGLSLSRTPHYPQKMCLLVGEPVAPALHKGGPQSFLFPGGKQRESGTIAVVPSLLCIQAQELGTGSLVPSPGRRGKQSPGWSGTSLVPSEFRGAGREREGFLRRLRLESSIKGDPR